MPLKLGLGNRDIYPLAFFYSQRVEGCPQGVTPLTCRLQCVVWGSGTGELPGRKKTAVLNTPEANYCGVRPREKSELQGHWLTQPWRWVISLWCGTRECAVRLADHIWHGYFFLQAKTSLRQLMAARFLMDPFGGHKDVKILASWQLLSSPKVNRGVIT